MSVISPNQLIHFFPNLRSEKKDSSTGYIWGKPGPNSNILRKLQMIGYTTTLLEIEIDDIIAERWISSDDREFGSWVINPLDKVKQMQFFQLLEQSGVEILGKKHWDNFGPYLGVVMKEIDTNGQPNLGSLSVQVHPKPGHFNRPAKPEMWQGDGNIFLGWKRDVTENELRKAYKSGAFDQLLNAIKLTPEKLVIVKGGTIHAIRYGTYTSEWSMAPGKDDINKGNLKDATISPYDKTDGKKARPGKEDLEAAIKLLKEYPDGFLKKTEAELLTKPNLIEQDDNSNSIFSLFRTPEVEVNEYRILTSQKISTVERGFPLYIKNGLVKVYHQGKVIGVLKEGQEVFVPAILKEITLEAQAPSIVQYWFKPFLD